MKKQTKKLETQPEMIPVGKRRTTTMLEPDAKPPASAAAPKPVAKPAVQPKQSLAVAFQSSNSAPTESSEVPTTSAVLEIFGSGDFPRAEQSILVMLDAAQREGSGSPILASLESLLSTNERLFALPRVMARLLGLLQDCLPPPSAPPPSSSQQAQQHQQQRKPSQLSHFSCTALLKAFGNEPSWPPEFVQAYVEDSIESRIWVDAEFAQELVRNICTAFAPREKMSSSHAPDSHQSQPHVSPVPEVTITNAGAESPSHHPPTTPSYGGNVTPSHPGSLTPSYNSQTAGNITPSHPGLATPSASQPVGSTTPNLSSSDLMQPLPIGLLSPSPASTAKGGPSAPNRFPDPETRSQIKSFIRQVVQQQLACVAAGSVDPRCLLKFAAVVCGYADVRTMMCEVIEPWFNSAPYGRLAKDLYVKMCSACHEATQEDLISVRSLLSVKMKTNQQVYLDCALGIMAQNPAYAPVALRAFLLNDISPNKHPSTQRLIMTAYRAIQVEPERELGLSLRELAMSEHARPVLRPITRRVIKSLLPDVNIVLALKYLLSESPEFLAQQQTNPTPPTAIPHFISNTVDAFCAVLLALAPVSAKSASGVTPPTPTEGNAWMIGFPITVSQAQVDALAWCQQVLPKYMPKIPTPLFISIVKKMLFLEPVNAYALQGEKPSESEVQPFQKFFTDLPCHEDALIYMLLLAMTFPTVFTGDLCLDLVERCVMRACSFQTKLHEGGHTDVSALAVTEIQLLPLVNGILGLCVFVPELPEELRPSFAKLCPRHKFWQVCRVALALAALNPKTVGLLVWNQLPTIQKLMESALKDQLSAAHLQPEPASAAQRESEIVRAYGMEVMQKAGQFGMTVGGFETEQDIAKLPQQFMVYDIAPTSTIRIPPQDVLPVIRQLCADLQLGKKLRVSRDPDFLLSLMQKESSTATLDWLSPILQNEPETLEIMPPSFVCELLTIDPHGKNMIPVLYKALIVRATECLFAESTSAETFLFFLSKLPNNLGRVRSSAQQSIAILLESKMSEMMNTADMAHQWVAHLVHLPCWAQTLEATADAFLRSLSVETDDSVFVAYLAFLQQHVLPVNPLLLAMHVAQVLVDRPVTSEKVMSHKDGHSALQLILVAAIVFCETNLAALQQAPDVVQVVFSDTNRLHVPKAILDAFVKLLCHPDADSLWLSAETTAIAQHMFPLTGSTVSFLPINGPSSLLQQLMNESVATQFVKTKHEHLIKAGLRVLPLPTILSLLSSFDTPASSLAIILNHLATSIPSDQLASALQSFSTKKSNFLHLKMSLETSVVYKDTFPHLADFCEKLKSSVELIANTKFPAKTAPKEEQKKTSTMDVEGSQITSSRNFERVWENLIFEKMDQHVELCDLILDGMCSEERQQEVERVVTQLIDDLEKFVQQKGSPLADLSPHQLSLFSSLLSALTDFLVFTESRLLANRLCSCLTKTALTKFVPEIQSACGLSEFLSSSSSQKEVRASFDVNAIHSLVQTKLSQMDEEEMGTSPIKRRKIAGPTSVSIFSDVLKCLSWFSQDLLLDFATWLLGNPTFTSFCGENTTNLFFEILEKSIVPNPHSLFTLFSEWISENHPTLSHPDFKTLLFFRANSKGWSISTENVKCMWESKFLESLVERYVRCGEGARETAGQLLSLEILQTSDIDAPHALDFLCSYSRTLSSHQITEDRHTDTPLFESRSFQNLFCDKKTPEKTRQSALCLSALILSELCAKKQSGLCTCGGLSLLSCSHIPSSHLSLLLDLLHFEKNNSADPHAFSILTNELRKAIVSSQSIFTTFPGLAKSCENGLSQNCVSLLFSIYECFPVELKTFAPECLDVLKAQSILKGGPETLVQDSANHTNAITQRLHRLLAILLQSDRGASQPSPSSPFMSHSEQAFLLCRQLCLDHPLLVLSHLHTISALLEHNVSVPMEDFISKGLHKRYMHVLGILDALRPTIFEHPSFPTLLAKFLSFLSYTAIAHDRGLLSLVSKTVDFLCFLAVSRPDMLTTPQHLDTFKSVQRSLPDLKKLSLLITLLTTPPSLVDPTELTKLPLSTEAVEKIRDALKWDHDGTLQGEDALMFEAQPSTSPLLASLQDLEKATQSSPALLAPFVQELSNLMAHGNAETRQLAHTMILRCLQYDPSVVTHVFPKYLAILTSPSIPDGVVKTAVQYVPNFYVFCCSRKEHAQSLVAALFDMGKDGLGALKAINALQILL